MSSQLNKVTICLIMTSLLVLMPHSGFLTNYENHSGEIDHVVVYSYSSNSDSVWVILMRTFGTIQMPTFVDI